MVRLSSVGVIAENKVFLPFLFLRSQAILVPAQIVKPSFLQLRGREFLHFGTQVSTTFLPTEEWWLYGKLLSSSCSILGLIELKCWQGLPCQCRRTVK